MGHTELPALVGCLGACAAPTLVVLTVRNPYNFLRSLYMYAWYGHQSQVDGLLLI